MSNPKRMKQRERREPKKIRKLWIRQDGLTEQYWGEADHLRISLEK